MSIREQRQKEAIDSYDGNERSLIKAAPRFGKILTAIGILKKLGIYDDILIAYPRKDIQEGWESDFLKWSYEGSVTFTTFRSLDKHATTKWKMVIIDEIHEMSRNQLTVLSQIKPPNLLALSGTVTYTTEKEIADIANVNVCYEYTIEKAVEEGILCDYTIHIHKVPLDTRKVVSGKTEKKRFSGLEYVYKQSGGDKKKSFHLYLKMIGLLQASLSKLNKTKSLLSEYKDDRVLVFCGLKDVADNLGCSTYHSGNKNKEDFLKFCQGDGDNHMATIKMAQAGITIKPINKGILNFCSGAPEPTAQQLCRFLGLEYDNIGKKANLHLVCSDEDFEINRVISALMFFDNSKVNWIN